MSLFTLARLGYAGALGTDALVEALVRLGAKWALSSSKVDREAGDAMVEAMRGEAPQLDGNLVNGITARQEDGATVVEASAIRASGGKEWDYAPFVERGTSHMSAEPFFYDQASDVLADRGSSLAAAAAAAGSSEGF